MMKTSLRSLTDISAQLVNEMQRGGDMFVVYVADRSHLLASS